MTLLKMSAALGFTMALAACAAQAPLKVYEGPLRQASEVALITVPEQIEVMAVDGHEPPASFLNSHVVLALLPGEHVFSLRYVELFQLTTETHDIVRSRQAALRFSATAGAAYTLSTPKQADHDAAKTFAKNPQFQLRNNKTDDVINSTPITSYAEASLIDTISKAFQSGKAEPQPVTNLDLLKDVWSRSTPEERNGFRAWLDQDHQGK
jgi:uncharacterized protein YccT (UPF0319 family)